MKKYNSNPPWVKKTVFISKLMLIVNLGQLPITTTSGPSAYIFLACWIRRPLLAVDHVTVFLVSKQSMIFFNQR